MVYLPLYKVTDTPFHIKRDDMLRFFYEVVRENVGVSRIETALAL